ncbi:hypothetical protein FGB62_25g158 [Gracilaria domingensis]|nr:hypothetical protein FGB62_25g158 [Gracilaria domingensis]
MQQTVLHEATADPPETEWASQIPLLQQEIAKLKRFLSQLESEEAEADQQLQSLTYALELTKSEAVRRKRSNNELQTAYNNLQTVDGDALDEQVQALEAELLNAKRDAANLVYEIEQLEFQIRRYRESDANVAHTYSEVVSPRSPPMTSPRVSLGTPLLTSPGTRPSRLIGDVDALVRVKVDEEQTDGNMEHFAMCRLGVSAGGHIAIYSYANADAVARLDEQLLSSGHMVDGDVEALRKALDSVAIQAGSKQYSLCGLREAVLSCKQLIERS